MIDLLNLNKLRMREQFASWGEPAYRATQVDRWLYRELATDFESMTDLPRDLRARLAESAKIGAPPVVAEASSADGLTRKALLQLDDGQTIETVLMLYPDAPGSPELEEPRDVPRDYKRRTVCISTQVGCPIGCPFCATGQAGYLRNLTPGEIVAQVLHFAREVRSATLTNVVIMGMGEPFMKFDVTWQAIETLTDPARFGMGARRVTVSTSGEIPGVDRLAREKLQINLAISLHAPDDDLRDLLVPLNRKYPLKELMRAVRAYADKTRRRVTFEYALMDGVNDKPEQARAIAQMLRGLLCHVNLIPLNPTAASPYGRTPYERVKAFEQILRDAGIPTTLRVEKGIEIAAGCGQLRQAAGPKSQV
ncbi:MAG: 23S rRNA (adenine(2503)-C(2))-methyltransferase RlmN [Chloroflexota bacterium]|nr:23S rRNA (adenine(2503)-C(2))-methyltransferase RlmN [Chloroflexota bacterium]